MNTLLLRLSITLALAVPLAVPFSLQAQVPQVISYEGRVAVGGVNFDSATTGQPGRFKFALVNADGTETYWSNDGTSVAGSEPTAAVSLTVTKGLYSVLLGDTAAPLSMSPISAAVFAHPDVRLRVWFNDGTNGSQLLSPDRRIASVAYALVAGNVADGVISSAKIAPGAVGSAHLSAGAVQAGSIAAGAVDNTKLVDATVTVTAGAGLGGGGVVSLGNAITLTNTGVLNLAGGGGITVSGANGNVTLGSNATNLSTGGTLVLRDANGDFSAGTITANLAGNATSAASALSAVSALTALTAGSATDFTGTLVGDVTGTQGATVVAKIGGIVPDSANTPGAVVKRDASGDFAVGTITGSLAGNATSATSALTALTAVSAVNFTGALAGDVTGPQGVTVVEKIGGIVPSSANTPDAVVKRNGDGDFAGGTITADIFVGNGGSLTGVPGTLPWQAVTGTAQNAAVNTGYLATNAAPVTVTLPAVVNIGDIVRVNGVGAGGWAMVPNVGQSVVGFGAGLGPTGPQGGGVAVQFIGFSQWQVLADAQLLAGSVQASHLAAGAVGSAQLAPNAVQAATIAAGAVQAGSIAAGAVDNSKLANAGFTLNTGAGLAGGGAVTLGGALTLSIPDAGVTGPKLADDAISTAKIAAGAVTNPKLANSSVTINAGAGLTGTSTVSLGGNMTLSIPNGGVTAAQLAPGAAAANYAADGQSFGLINNIAVNQWLGTAGTPTFAGETILNTGTGLNKPSLVLDRGLGPLVVGEGTGPKGRLTFQKSSLDPAWSGLVLSVNADWDNVNGYATDDPNRSQSIFQMEYEWSELGFPVNEVNWTSAGRRLWYSWGRADDPTKASVQWFAPTKIIVPSYESSGEPALFVEDYKGGAAAGTGDRMQLVLQNSNPNPATSSGVAFRMVGLATSAEAPTGTDWYFGTDRQTNGGNNFFILDSKQDATRLFIGNTGNVGLGGNTTPVAKLDVIGSINVTGAYLVNGAPATGQKLGVSRLAVELPSLNSTTQLVALAPNSGTPAVHVQEGSDVLKMMSLEPGTWKGRVVKVGMLVAVNGTSGQDLAYRLMISHTTKTLDGTDNTAVFPDPAHAEVDLPNANWQTAPAPIVAGAVKWIESPPITIPLGVTALAANCELAKAKPEDTNTDAGYILEIRVIEQ